MDDYVTRVIAEYNKWAGRLAEARTPDGGITNQCVAAFMCNAIGAAIAKSTVEEFKDRFYAEGYHEHAGTMYYTEQIGDVFEARVLLPPPYERGRPKGQWLWVKTLKYGTNGEAHDAARELIDRV